jgi:hypothetical protein
MKRFWLVWREHGMTGEERWYPRKLHYTLESAQDEAGRLAGKYPSEKFYVVRAVGYAQTENPPTTWSKIR